MIATETNKMRQEQSSQSHDDRYCHNLRWTFLGFLQFKLKTVPSVESCVFGRKVADDDDYAPYVCHHTST